MAMSYTKTIDRSKEYPPVWFQESSDSHPGTSIVVGAGREDPPT